MVLSLQLRLVLVCLAVTIGCVYAEREYKIDRQFQALEDESSERQLISGIKKWFTRSGEAKQQTPTKTKIKYLPVYVPFPVQPSIKVPPEHEYYGAYQDPGKKEEVESMYQGVQMLPNSHVVDYSLPVSGQLPMFLRRKDYTPFYTPNPMTYHHDLHIANDDNSHYGYDDMFTTGILETEAIENDDSSEYDSEVLENPEFFKTANKKTGGRLRKVRRKNNQPRPRKFAF